MRVTSHMKPKPATPEHERRDHRVDVDRPEARRRPTGFVQERQVMLDVLGRGDSVAGGHRGTRSYSVSRGQQRHSEQQHRDHEGGEERRQHDVLVRRQHQPELEDDHEDLGRLGAEHRHDGAARGRRSARYRQHDRVDDRRGSMLTDAAQRRRQRCRARRPTAPRRPRSRASRAPASAEPCGSAWSMSGDFIAGALLTRGALPAIEANRSILTGLARPRQRLWLRRAAAIPRPTVASPH